jgi:CubicO group peptidase (beta-lactamase class C family)
MATFWPQNKRTKCKALRIWTNNLPKNAQRKFAIDIYIVYPEIYKSITAIAMLKQIIVLYILFFVLSSTSAAQSIQRLDNSKISFSQADDTIRSLMKAGNVTGLAISIFNNNHRVYEKTFGHKRSDTKEPIKNTTNIYGASLSKSVFAVMVMKLVEEGVLDLDKPLQEYLPKPIYEYAPVMKWHDNYSDLKNDTLYKKITARMCLDHTSGFPNWRWFEPDQKLRVNFTPGSKFSYSGEGLVYLQVVLEKMLGKSLEELMKEKVFKPAGMTRSSYKWQKEFEDDYCLGHDANGKPYEKDKDNDARSASTLETTLDDLTKFVEAVLNNRILKSSTTKQMFTPQIRIRSSQQQQFGPNSWRDTSANDAIALSYGLGWGFLKSPYGIGAFKEGHGDGFQHYLIIFPKKGTGILIMTNSDNGESIFKYLLASLIGDQYTPWYWENYFPYDYTPPKRSILKVD